MIFSCLDLLTGAGGEGRCCACAHWIFESMSEGVSTATFTSLQCLYLLSFGACGLTVNMLAFQAGDRSCRSSDFKT